jgi:hypothetical protein
MMKRLFFVVSFFYLVLNISNAQIKDFELGAEIGRFNSNQSGYFNFSDPEAVNIKVSVWGFVKYPGRYTVPIYTTVTDLLSYAGGPMDASDLTDLRLYRVDEDSTQALIKFNYNDLLWENNLKTKFRKLPTLLAGDILVVPGEPRLYFRDHMSIWLSIISVLISLSILVINIAK